MRTYIKKIQSKSEDTRKLIFVSSLVVCMSVVVFIWVYNLGTRFSDPKVADQTSQDIKPFQIFSNTISDTYKSVSASVGKAPTVDIPKDDTSQITNDKRVDLTPVENNNQ